MGSVFFLVTLYIIISMKSWIYILFMILIESPATIKYFSIYIFFLKFSNI